jgi:plastocyanin
VSRRIAVLAALAALLVMPLPAYAATSTVTLSDSMNSFQSGSPTINFGDGVQWQTNSTTNPHTSTADKFNLWDLNLPTGSNTYGPVSFPRAGGFAYHCEVHGGMRGTVRVRMMASDNTPMVGQTISILFAATNAPAGFIEQVQKRKVGGTWKTFATSTGTSVNWTPAKAKTFQFRARLKRTSDGTSTLWSPILQLPVSN